jgi:hypothetical protein
MKVKYPVYDDGVISVSLFAEDHEAAGKDLFYIAIRWLPPQTFKDKKGKDISVTNIMGGETDWFILPHSFGAAVGKRLIAQRVAGLDGFNKEGFTKMVSWLVEMEEIQDSMNY